LLGELKREATSGIPAKLAVREIQDRGYARRIQASFKRYITDFPKPLNSDRWVRFEDAA